MEDTTNMGYKEMLETIRQMEESADTFKGLVYNSIEEDGYDINAVEKFAKEIKIENLKNQPDEDIEKSFYVLGIKDAEAIKKLCKEFHEYEDAKGSIQEDGSFKSESDEELRIRMEKFEEEYESKKYTFMRRVLTKLLENINQVDATYKEADDLKKEANENISNYINYISSDEYQKKKEEKIEAMRKEAMECTNPYDKKKLLATCDQLEASMNMSFVVSSMEKLGENAYKNIMETFLDDRRSNYVIERYKAKISKFGYKEDVYQYFFGIEEKFLDEKYHVFNNLFLFFLIRFVGYADPYSKKDQLYVKALITNTANLVYQKYSSDTQMNKFISVISDFLDHFEEYRSIFDKKNILHPNHPERLSRKKKQEEDIRKMIYANFAEMDYEVTDEVKNLGMDELRKLYDEVLDETKKSKEEKSEMGELIKKMHLNDEIHEREILKKAYLKYSELTDEMNEKFNTLSINNLKKIVSDLEYEAAHSTLDEVDAAD